MRLILLLFMSASAGFANEIQTESNPLLTPEEAKAAMRGVTEISNEGRLVPVFENGKPVGYRKAGKLPVNAKIDRVGLKKSELLSIPNEEHLEE